jgi:hypothetical protein
MQLEQRASLQVEAGFTRMLVGLDDYVLDVPDAAHLMTLFTARAIVDELMPPAWLHRVLDSLAVVRNTGRLLAQPHAAERILQCWHGGLRTVAGLKASMKALISEYLTNPDIPASLAEAHHSLAELAVPHYHHEYTKLLLSAAFDHPDKRDAVAHLLKYHSDSGAPPAHMHAPHACALLQRARSRALLQETSRARR